MSDIYRMFALIAAGGIAILGGLGCSGPTTASGLLGDLPKQQQELPANVDGTIAQYAELSGGGEMAVSGYGVVAGLGNSGSREVPSHLREYLTQYMLKQKVFSPMTGTGNVSPSRILEDLDTAVVVVTGIIPPGAPPGTIFDLQVTALPQTQTQSLDGGYLYPVELSLSIEGAAGVARASKPMAEGGGPVFINPFIDPSSPAEAAKLREGRIIAGGVVLEPRPIRLILYQADYARCSAIEKRINERFHTSPPVAVAKNPSVIEINIPLQFQADYERFLQLLMHMPVRGGPAQWEAQSRKIGLEMQNPSADHDALALVWEATGKGVLPIIQPLYDGENPLVAFYAARTGCRLEDATSVQAIARTAAAKDSPLRLQAIGELGLHRQWTSVLKPLHQLLDDPNELVRVAAYEALVNLDDGLKVQRVQVGKSFYVDIVDTSGPSVICASQSLQQRIVLFGRDMRLQQPMFLSTPGELVTISSGQVGEPLRVYRKIIRSGKFSDVFNVDNKVFTLIEVMGSPPYRGADNSIKGMGLTYGQVVAVLNRLCESGEIRAKFVLQPLPQMKKIYQSPATVGRPDVPQL